MARIHLADHRSRGYSGRPLPEQNAEVETRDGAVPAAKGSHPEHQAVQIRRHCPGHRAPKITVDHRLDGRRSKGVTTANPMLDESRTNPEEDLPTPRR